MIRRSLPTLGTMLLAVPGVAVAQTVTQASAGWDPQAILRAEHYVNPPATIERIVKAPRSDISFAIQSADRSWFIRTPGKDRGTVKDWGKPHLFLGGVQVDPNASRARSLTTETSTALEVVNAKTGETKTLQTPAGATISSPQWSPVGAQIAYIANFPTASYVYVADVASGRSTQISRAPLLATLVTQVAWTADGKSLVAVVAPEGRGAAPTHGAGGIEDGPQVRFSVAGRATPQPVHASLLEDPHDKALLKYHATGQLALFDVARKSVRRIGAPAIIRSIDASPDARYFRVTQIVEPFSYIVPVSAFGTVQELWDANGKSIATLAKTPLREEQGRGGQGGGPGAAGADTGKRNIQWHPAGQGLVYLQSVFPAPAARGDSGTRPQRGQGAGARTGASNTARPQAIAVRYVNWRPPYGPGDTATLHQGGAQLTNVAWSADGKLMFVSDSGQVSAIRVSEPTKKHPLGRGVSIPSEGGQFGGGGGGFGAAPPADTVGTGGALAMKAGPNGERVVVLSTDGKSVVVSGSRSYGEQWSTRAPRPWADRLDIESGKRTRIFDSPADAYERIVTALDDDYAQVIYTRQSRTAIEDAWLRDTRSGASKQLTHAVDVAPEVTGATRKRVQVSRPRDGTKLWVDVVFPRGWQKGSDTPGIIWFYPREFATEQAYRRSKYSVNINEFPAVPAARPATATELWAAAGYVYIVPDIPIFGDSGKMNDNYTRDLKENLDAVLDAIVDSGFVRRDRMGIGGHSYGAFSTVNAMTLVPYFKAGIAGDGMYNRTLTPFGFQSERRNFFEAQDTYMDMSPFLRADKISGALLMYHGLEDQNQGTAPISSTRMMAALQGLGKTAALYLYPYEDHSVATYESDLDLWARWIAWFDVHLKNVPTEPITP